MLMNIYFHYDLMYMMGLHVETVGTDELFILQFCPSVVFQAVRIMCGCVLTYGYKRKRECMAIMST
jgi:hypothetical protein